MITHPDSEENRKPGCCHENHGHKDMKTAMQDQHPELEIVRAALDQDPAVEKRV